MKTIRWFIAELLWKSARISRSYCWASAVTWAEGWGNPLLEAADHRCFYCNACNTPEEIKAHEIEYLKQAEVTQ